MVIILTIAISPSEKSAVVDADGQRQLGEKCSQSTSTSRKMWFSLSKLTGYTFQLVNINVDGWH